MLGQLQAQAVEEKAAAEEAAAAKTEQMPGQLQAQAVEEKAAVDESVSVVAAEVAQPAEALAEAPAEAAVEVAATAEEQGRWSVAPVVMKVVGVGGAGGNIVSRLPEVIEAPVLVAPLTSFGCGH